MKLIICGKGGSGKSTISALLARAYAERGFKVLVVDSDESNFGLHRQLGLELPEDFTHFFGHKKGIYEEGAQDVFAGGWHLEDIPGAYMSTDGSVRLMATGKIADAGEGCACAMGTLTKTFLEHLKLRDDEVAIVDTEAGVEHFGRGIDHRSRRFLVGGVRVGVGEAEIDEFDVRTLVGDQNVFRFQIAVVHLLSVDVGQCIANLAEQLLLQHFVDRTVGIQFFKRTAVNPFHFDAGT